MSLTVGEVMSRQVQAVEPPTTCLTAWEFMRRTGTGQVAVVSHQSGRIHGVLSREDIAVAWCEHGEPPFRLTLGELLLGRLRPRVHAETPVGLAARIMLDSGFTVLPVLGADSSLIGLVTARDVLAAVAGRRSRGRTVPGSIRDDRRGAMAGAGLVS